MDRYPRALGVRVAVTLPGGARNGVDLAPTARRATAGRTPTRRARDRGVTGGGEPARVCRPVATLGGPGQRVRPCGAVQGSRHTGSGVGAGLTTATGNVRMTECSP
jgi:hypothetical protein